MTLAFYMKSGNVVRAYHVEKYTIKTNDHDNVVAVEITWALKGNLLLNTLDLKQIEAVVEE